MKLLQNSGVPIYQQIAAAFREDILTQQRKAGEYLPSIRGLAKELKISVSTTKRAYEELEREGFIVSFTGKGSFVASQNLDFLREQKQKEIEEHLQQAVDAAKNLGILADELTDMLHIMYEGE